MFNVVSNSVDGTLGVGPEPPSLYKKCIFHEHQIQFGFCFVTDCLSQKRQMCRQSNVWHERYCLGLLPFLRCENILYVLYKNGSFTFSACDETILECSMLRMDCALLRTPRSLAQQSDVTDSRSTYLTQMLPRNRQHLAVLISS